MLGSEALYSLETCEEKIKFEKKLIFPYDKVTKYHGKNEKNRACIWLSEMLTPAGVSFFLECLAFFVNSKIGI
jgi:hypothetical protein